MAALRPYTNRHEEAERAWFDEWHYLATAVAGNIGDAGWHEHVRLTIEAHRLRSYAKLMFLVQMQSQMGMHGGIKKEEGEVATKPGEEQVDKCEGKPNLNFGTNSLPGGNHLPFSFNVGMTCEGMSLEASIPTDIPNVSLSAEIGGDNAGSFTAFVGPKAEVSAGLSNIAEFSASAKAGAYVSGNRSGVQEAGVKYVVNAGATLGNNSASTQIAEGHVNFIPAPDPGDGGLVPIGTR
jgi:hypothetical protein